MRWLRHPRKVSEHHTANGFMWLSVETANDQWNYHHSHLVCTYHTICAHAQQIETYQRDN